MSHYQSPDERTFKIVVLRTFSDLFLKYFNFDDFIEFTVYNFIFMLRHLFSLYKMCVTHVFKAKPIPTKYVCKIATFYFVVFMSCLKLK